MHEKTYFLLKTAYIYIMLVSNIKYANSCIFVILNMIGYTKVKLSTTIDFTTISAIIVIQCSLLA